MKVTGSIVALVTPLFNDTVDVNSLQDLVVWHAEQGTDYIVVVGSTGESSLLSEEERVIAIKAAVDGKKKSNDKIKIIAGVGSPSTLETIKMAKNAENCGVDGIMIVTPSYVKPTQAGAIKHFKLVAESVNLPVIIYNHPGRTGTNLQIPTLIELCNTVQSIVAIKDSTANLESIAVLRSQLPEKVTLLSGDDATNIGFLAQGGEGIISVTGNIFPKLCKEFVKSFENGDLKKASDIHKQLMPVHKSMFCEPNPCPAKYALFKMGKIKNEVRMPLFPIEENSVSAESIINSMKMVDRLVFGG